MEVEIKQALIQSLELRLFPALARWFLEAGVGVQDAVELFRTAAVMEAQRSIPAGIDPQKIVSLISSRTGLSRRLVRKIRSGVKREGRAALRGGHRGERVLAGWWHDSAYRDQRGRPRILSISDSPHSFEALCRQYSGERQYRTILKDLEQAGAVAVLPGGDRVQILRQNYAAVSWTEAGQAAMAEQLAEHVETCLHNFRHPEGSQHLMCRRVVNPQVRREYANILLRDLRTHIDTETMAFYDALTDPQYTAEPADPSAEHISVTVYIHRRPVLGGASESDTTRSVAVKDEKVHDAPESRPPRKLARQPTKRRR